MSLEADVTEGSSTASPAPRLATGAFWAGIASIGFSLGNFVSTVLVARFLGPDGAGVVAYLVWLTSALSVGLGFGITETLTRYVAEAAGLGRVARPLASFLGLRYAVLGFVAVPVVTLAVALATDVDPRMLLLVVWLFVSFRVFTFVRALFSGIERFKTLALWTAASSVVQVSAVLLLTPRFGPEGAIAGWAMGMSLFLLPLLLTRLDRGDAGAGIGNDLEPRIRRYAFAAWLAALLSLLVWQRLEFVFLDAFVGPRAVGLFAVAASFAGLVAQVPTFFTQALVPYFARQFGSGGDEAARATYALATRAVAFVALPFCFVAAALAPVAIDILYGNSFHDALVPTRLLLVGAALGVVASVESSLVHGFDRPAFIAVASAIGAGLIVLVGFTVVPAFGVEGAASGKAVVQSLMVGIGAWYAQTRLGMKVPVISVGKILVAAALAALVAGVTYGVVGDFLGVVTAVSGALVAYGLSVALLRVWDRGEWSFLRGAVGHVAASFRISARGSTPLS